MTRIVNCHHHKCDVICDRSSIFGNPFRIVPYTRNEACDLYEIYFHNRIKQDMEFKRRVLGLKNLRIGCWCRCLPPCNNPKCKSHRCHVETIIKYLENV